DAGARGAAGLRARHDRWLSRAPVGAGAAVFPGQGVPVMRAHALTLAARYVFPVEGPPIEGGGVTIRDGRIGWLGPLDGRKPDHDLGNAAIVPGFVNAHTHLELSSLKRRRAAKGVPDNQV